MALGTNENKHFDQTHEVIKASYDLLQDKYLKILKASPFYKTPAFPAGSGPDYVNSVIKAETALCPKELMTVLHDIENQLGRVRQKRWGARVIDIDLLDYQGQILPSRKIYQKWRDMPLELQKTTWPDDLILPHPRIQDRGFVLVPLRAVAPDWRHPVTSEKIDTFIAQIDSNELKQIVQLPSG
ncbi:MAG: 2-amino-4-hydroxy-6-hydroxymethyldihydropteridine diphosphokinase [Amylibacter sp.]|nr:2-amino-4-hydroxy-6-hydroxymethyldihydropteridine diphosphokinase [Amylibacter sp.]